MGVEERGVERDGQAHHFRPGRGPVGVKRQDSLLERLVEMAGIVVVGGLGGTVPAPD